MEGNGGVRVAEDSINISVGVNAYELTKIRIIKPIVIFCSCFLGPLQGKKVSKRERAKEKLVKT